MRCTQQHEYPTLPSLPAQPADPACDAHGHAQASVHPHGSEFAQYAEHEGGGGGDIKGGGSGSCVGVSSARAWGRVQIIAAIRMAARRPMEWNDGVFASLEEEIGMSASKQHMAPVMPRRIPVSRAATPNTELPPLRSRTRPTLMLHRSSRANERLIDRTPCESIPYIRYR